MKLQFTPQRSNDNLIYNIDGDVLTVTYQKAGKNEKGGQTILEEFTDTFDFSDFPDGEVEDIETDLPINPIRSAVRENGELTVTVFNWYNKGEESEREPIYG